MTNRYSGPIPTPHELALLTQPQQAPTPPEDQHIIQRLRTPDDSTEPFCMLPAAEWLQTDSPYFTEAPLFGHFWHRGEVCILFADTNVGKSILAVQIADSLSKAQPIPGFDTTPRPETVLYFDFELTAPQFTLRYTSADGSHYPFAPGFARLVFNPLAEGEDEFDSYTQYLNNAIQDVIEATGARVIIIDNITCLHSATHSNITAINLMKKLQQIKRLYGLSILVLAHTPKRNPSRPITHNHLQGSKMLINFADAAFAIGESQTQSGVRYLKQVKQRSGQLINGADSVCLCRIVKPHNFLHMEFLGTEPEADHLLAYTEYLRKATEDRVAQLHHNGDSIRAIATQTGMSIASIHRLINRLSRVE